MARDVTSVTGVEELVLLAKVKFGKDFKLSKFVRDCLESVLFEGEEITDPRLEAAKRAANTVIRERLAQKKLVEDTRSYETIAKEMMKRDDEKFLSFIKLVFKDDLSVYFKELPECKQTDNHLFWDSKANALTELCCFNVSPEKVQQYIRENA